VPLGDNNGGIGGFRGEPAEVRLSVRTQHSAPLLAELRKWMDATLSRVSGRSEMAKAIRYALARWDALTLVLRDGRVCIDNNAAERSMRPMTLGRNYVRSRIMCSSDRRLPLNMRRTADLRISLSCRYHT
jgi:Transposase IS66 family